MVNMGNIWDRTTEFLSDNATALWPIAVVGVFLPQSVAALMRGAGAAVSPVLLLAVTIVCALISLWGQLGIVALALDPAGGRARATAAATRGYLRALGALVIVYVALSILLLPIVGVLAANGVDVTSSQYDGSSAVVLPGGARALLTVYSILWLVTTFVVWVRTSLVNPLVVSEGGVVRAIRHSFVFSRGIAWKMVGVWLLFAIVAIVAWLAVTLTVGAVLGIFDRNPTPFGLTRLIVALLGSLVATLFYVVIGVFSAELYQAVTGPREGAPAA